MLFRQLGLGRADAPNYKENEAPRGQQDQSKTTWKDMVYVILELSLCRNKGQPVDTVKQRTSLHLKTPDNHSGMLTDMCKRH